MNTHLDHPLKIMVLGSGAFGSALAYHALSCGHDVTLVTYLDSQLMDWKRKNTSFTLLSQQSWQGVLPTCQLILLAVPCQALSETCQWLKSHWQQDTGLPAVVSVAKGIELGTLHLPHQILNHHLPPETAYGTLSGPSFATELLAELPTSVVIASSDQELTQLVQKALHHKAFRVYAATDIVGVDVGGALKNVVAMAAGAVDGLGLGNNARASLITRGLNEMAQLGVKLGAEPLTFLGLSGLGDLVLTCTSPLSRNWKFGYGLAQGKSRDVLEENMGQVIEGVTTAKSAYQLSLKLGLDTPIFFAIYNVLYENLPIKEAVSSLIGREYKKELNWLP